MLEIFSKETWNNTQLINPRQIVPQMISPQAGYKRTVSYRATTALSIHVSESPSLMRLQTEVLRVPLAMVCEELAITDKPWKKYIIVMSLWFHYVFLCHQYHKWSKFCKLINFQWKVFALSFFFLFFFFCERCMWFNYSQIITLSI